MYCNLCTISMYKWLTVDYCIEWWFTMNGNLNFKALLRVDFIHYKSEKTHKYSCLFFKLTFTIVKVILDIQGVPINMGIERRLDFLYLMHGKESIKTMLYV